MKAKSTRGESTRRRILSSAAELIYKRGVNGTSVDDVLAASKAGKSQFYHYFTSKDDLVREVLGFRLEGHRIAGDRLDAIASPEDLNAWLDSIAEDYRRGVYEDGCPIGNLAAEMAGQSESLRSDLQAVFSDWEERLAGCIRRLVSQGHFRPGTEATAVATMLVSAIEGALLLAKTDRKITPLESTVKQLQIFLRGLNVGATSKPRRALAPAPRAFSYCP